MSFLAIFNFDLEMTLKWPYMSFLAIFKFDLEMTLHVLPNNF